MYDFLFGIYHKTMINHKTATLNGNTNKHLIVNSRINTLEWTAIKGAVEKKMFIGAVNLKI